MRVLTVDDSRTTKPFDPVKPVDVVQKFSV